MTRKLLFAFILLFGIAPLSAQNARQVDFILNMTSQVNSDSLSTTIMDLESFVSRHSENSNRIDVANYIADRFRNYGLDVKLDTFMYVNSASGIGYEQYNVIAKLEGRTTEPPVLIGAHHDSCCRTDSSPGADDNASGVAAVIEAARIFTTNDYFPRRSVYFSTWAAEEQGLLGSKDFANKIFQQGVELDLVINLDMIANNNLDYNAVNVQVSSSIEDQVSIFSNLIENLTYVGVMNSGNSDHAPFLQKSYLILYFHEYDFSPVYHTPRDLFDRLNMEYSAIVVKAALANLTAFSSMLMKPNFFVVGNSGSGSGVYAEWDTVAGAVAYRVLLKSSTEVIYDTVVVNQTFIRVENINSEYVELIVKAVDDNDFEGKQSLEFITLNPVPEVISDLKSSAEESHISLRWSKPSERDLQHIQIMMRNNDSDLFDTIALVTPEVTSYNISLCVNSFFHFKVRRFDFDGNAGADSKTVTSALATFDKGMLVVSDVTSNPFGFSADSIHSFFTALDVILPTTIRRASRNMPNLFKSYNLVLWHSINASVSQALAANQEYLEEFLAAGGSLIITTDYPQKLIDVKNLKNSTYTIYNPVRKFLGITKTSYVDHSRMERALGTFFPDLNVDPNKVSSIFEGNLKDFCAMETEAPFVSIYKSFTTHSNNFMNDNTVGFISYDEPKMCVLGFPLFYLEHSSVVNFMRYLYQGGFYTSTTSFKAKMHNLEVYPNPFHNNIELEVLPQDRTIVVEVFNMQGVKVLSEVYNHLPLFEKQIITVNASALSQGAYILKMGEYQELIIKK